MGTTAPTVTEEAGRSAPPPPSRLLRLRVAGFCLGLASGVAFGAVRLPVHSQPVGPGASVTMEAAPTGELDVSPTGLVGSDHDLRPAEPGGLSGAVTVRNQTQAPLAVWLRVDTEHGMLDEALVVRADVEGKELLHGAVEKLRHARSPSFILAAGESAAVGLGARLSSPLTGGYQGVEETVRIRFETRRDGG